MSEQTFIITGIIFSLIGLVAGLLGALVSWMGF